MSALQTIKQFISKYLYNQKQAIDFSIVIPTKGRNPGLKNSIDSIISNSLNTEKLEIFLIYDKGDDLTKGVINELKLKYKKIITIIEVNIDYDNRNMSRDYLNPSALKANGKYIIGLGDDTLLITKHWDFILKEAIEEFLTDKPDRIAYVTIDDEAPRQRKLYSYCAFPLLTRETVQVLDGYMPKEITAHGADVSLFHIFNCLDYNRVLRMWEFVKLEHHCPYNGRTMEADEVTKNLPQRVFDLTPQQYKFYIGRLNEHIQESNSRCPGS